MCPTAATTRRCARGARRVTRSTGAADAPGGSDERRTIGSGEDNGGQRRSRGAPRERGSVGIQATARAAVRAQRSAGGTSQHEEMEMHRRIVIPGLAAVALALTVGVEHARAGVSIGINLIAPPA